MESATLFLETQQVSQAMEFALYVSKFKGEAEGSSPFLDEARKHASAGNPGNLYTLLVRESGALFNAPEKEFEGAYNLLIALLQHVPTDARRALVKTALKIIVESNTDKSALKLKALSNLFNTLKADDPLRYDVYLAVLAFAEKADELERLFAHLPHLETWARQWGASADQICDLHLKISEKLQSRGSTKEAYNFLVKHLQSYNEETASTALPIARRAVILALSTTGLWAYEDILTLPAIHQLQKGKEKLDKEFYALLRIFIDGDLAGYRKFAASNSALFDAELTQDGCERKMRLLTIAALGTNRINEEISYKELAEALQVNEDEVELWIIDVIREGLAEAKMNQLHSTVTISRSTYRAFGREEWKQLGAKLHAWRSSLSNILSVVGNAKLIVSGGQTVSSTSHTADAQPRVSASA